MRLRLLDFGILKLLLYLVAVVVLLVEEILAERAEHRVFDPCKVLFRLQQFDFKTFHHESAAAEGRVSFDHLKSVTDTLLETFLVLLLHVSVFLFVQRWVLVLHQKLVVNLATDESPRALVLLREFCTSQRKRIRSFRREGALLLLVLGFKPD